MDPLRLMLGDPCWKRALQGPNWYFINLLLYLPRWLNIDQFYQHSTFSIGLLSIFIATWLLLSRYSPLQTELSKFQEIEILNHNKDFIAVILSVHDYFIAWCKQAGSELCQAQLKLKLDGNIEFKLQLFNRIMLWTLRLICNQLIEFGPCGLMGLTLTSGLKPAEILRSEGVQNLKAILSKNKHDMVE